MSYFTGPQGTGAAVLHRATKKREAEERNALTPHERTRRHRLDKCDEGEHLLLEVFATRIDAEIESAERLI